jgi:hypothetical protein
MANGELATRGYGSTCEYNSRTEKVMVVCRGVIIPCFTAQVQSSRSLQHDGGRISLLPSGTSSRAGPEASTPARAWLGHARAEVAGGEGWATAVQRLSHEQG